MDGCMHAFFVYFYVLIIVATSINKSKPLFEKPKLFCFLNTKDLKVYFQNERSCVNF